MNSSLQSIFESLNLKSSQKIEKQLMLYLNALGHWNRRINLTGAKDLDEIISGPLFDAMTLIPALIDIAGKQPFTLADIGTGGGLPGIPAAICLGNVELTLIEPRARKTTFLRHIDHTLNLKTSIVQARDNELKSGNWDCVVSQAVWPPLKWINIAVRLVKKGGCIFALSSKELNPLKLPDNTDLINNYFFTRPKDNTNRYVTVVRRR